jgi:hypothetical protein
VLGTTARSIAAWVKVTDSAVANPTIVEWGNNANGERYTFKVNTSAGNGLAGGLRVEVQGGFIISGSRVIDDGQWHHVVATFGDDGTPDVEDVLLYVDGFLDNLSPPTTPNPEPINTAGLGNLTVGGSFVFVTSGAAGAAGRPFAGLIDEVGVWSRVLDANEIATLVPEPSTLALTLLGAGVLMLRRRCR